MEFVASNASEMLPRLAFAVMSDGREVGTRGGSRTKELLYVQTTLTSPWQREILTPGRKASLPAQIAETMWVLTGRNDIDFLSHYLPRAEQFSDDGLVWRGGYGPRLRAWTGYTGSKFDEVDQLAHVIEMLKREPEGRRAVMAIYDPRFDSADGKDIPCNDFITFQQRFGKLHMGVTIRSNDLIWGWSGINAFEWSVLQEIVAWMIGAEIGELHFHQASLHVYDRHWDRAVDLANEVSRSKWKYKPSPRFGGLRQRRVLDFDIWAGEWFKIEEQIRMAGKWHGEAVEHFPDPMLQAWLRVLQWHWSNDVKYLEPLAGTALEAAALLTPRSM